MIFKHLTEFFRVNERVCINLSHVSYFDSGASVPSEERLNVGLLGGQRLSFYGDDAVSLRQELDKVFCSSPYDNVIGTDCKPFQKGK